MSTAATCWALAYLILLAPGASHLCLAQSESNSTVSTGYKTVSSPSDRTTDFLQRLADARVFSGTVAVQRGGSIAFNEGYGYAMEVSRIVELFCALGNCRCCISNLPLCRMSSALSHLMLSCCPGALRPNESRVYLPYRLTIKVRIAPIPSYLYGTCNDLQILKKQPCSADIVLSLSRFFTTVAINQLAKQGFLNVSDLVRVSFSDMAVLAC